MHARKALNRCDVLGSDIGAIRIGFARVPIKNRQEGSPEKSTNVSVQGISNLNLGASIHALQTAKGALTIPADQQVLSRVVDNYRSNLLLNMLSSSTHSYITNGIRLPGFGPMVTEQQMIIKELAIGSADADADIQALTSCRLRQNPTLFSEFHPPTTHYMTIPLV